MAYDFSKMVVLIVEDSQPMRVLLKSLLTAMGVEKIYEAKDGQHGLELVMSKDPDLVITDWMMDPINGIEFTKNVRNTKGVPNPFVPIIMMTGFSSKFRVEEARDIGITEFLVKPFTAYELYRRIAQVIEKPRKFVKSELFFGPDRRRHMHKDYNGPRRRAGEKDMSEEARKASEVIRNIRNKTKIGAGSNAQDDDLN